MARVTANQAGQIWQVFRSEPDLLARTPDPLGVLSIDFDGSTNAALLADLAANPNSYSMASASGVTTLHKNGAPVVITAASAPYSLQSAILTGVPIATLQTAIVALWNGTATAQQQQKALAYCLLKLHQAGII